MKLVTVLKTMCENFNEAEMKVGDTFESDFLRVHRYRDQIQVTDVVNAGKRGKKCREFSIGTRKHYQDSFSDFYDLVEKITDKTTYNEALADAKFLASKDDSYTVYESEKRGVDVIPTSLKPFEYSNEKFYIRSDIQSFTIRDLTDRHNEPTCISTDNRTGVRGVKKLYDYLTKNSEKIKDMDFNQVTSLVSDLGIGYHHYCAVD